MKVELYLRLFIQGNPLPCSAAVVTVDVTPNSISYNTSDLVTLCYFMDEQESEGLDWQKVGDAIFSGCRLEYAKGFGSAKIPVGNGYEMTWRKL